MQFYQKLSLGLLSLSLIFSCQKDPDIIPVDEHNHAHGHTRPVMVKLTNVADNDIVQVSRDTMYTALTPTYKNAYGDTFSITTLKYYVTNIKFKRANGTYYVEPESYRIIDAADTSATCHFVIPKVPIDNYVAMEFIIGVDSARNVSGAQTGALDPNKDMFWSWAQGYIFYKFEGFTSSVPVISIHNLNFHIGGFAAPQNLIRWAIIPFGSTTLNVEENTNPTIYLKANVLEAFRNPSVLSFSVLAYSNSMIHSKMIANNYNDMFSLAAIKY